MGNKFSFIRPIALLLISLAALVAIGGCNGSSDSVRSDVTYNYQIQAVLVKDVNTSITRPDTTLLALELKREDTILTTAVVTFGGDTLVYGKDGFPVDSVYSFDSNPAHMMPTGIYYAIFRDSSRATDTAYMVVTDTFSIAVVVPTNRISNGGDQVSLQWTSAAGIEGYVIAAVLRDSAYTGYGYSEYVTSLTTEDTFPPDAFRLIDPNVADTGWYYLYVYGYTGVPDSVIASALLPVPWPSNLTNENIDKLNLRGQTGSVVVTKKDSVHVVLIG